jgi:hypothetical protein
MVNDLAKADMASLQPEQDLAAYSAYKVPSALPSILCPVWERFWAAWP